MTDAIRELFELLTKKEKSGSDYTGTVTRVDGKTAYVQFDGSDITDTPVALSIGAKAGDSVRVRVADGRAWLVGNDDAPPNDSSEVGYELALTNALIRQLTTEQINGENGWINLLKGTFNYGNRLIWNGSILSLIGKIETSEGKVAGWVIGASTISSGTKGANTALVTLTSGNDSSITIESNTSTAKLGRAGITFRNNSDPNRTYSGIAWNGIVTSLHDNDGDHEAVLYPTYLRVGYPSSTNKTFIREGTGTFSGNVSAATFTEGGTALANKYAPKSSSDIRLKENVDECEVDSALEIIDRIKLHSFDWKGDGEHQQIGFVADELEEIDERLVDGGGYDADGEMIIKSVDTFYLQGYEVKAIQELHAEINSLKAEIAELKNIIAVLMEGKT